MWGLNGKKVEKIDVMEETTTHILTITETKKKGRGCIDTGKGHGVEKTKKAQSEGRSKIIVKQEIKKWNERWRRMNDQ